MQILPLMPGKREEQGPGALLQVVTVALAWGVSRIPLSKFELMSGPETNFTLITSRAWQMGLPSSAEAPPSLQSPTRHSISGGVCEIYHTKSRRSCEISHSEIYHRQIDLAQNPPPPPLLRTMAGRGAHSECCPLSRCSGIFSFCGVVVQTRLNDVWCSARHVQDTVRKRQLSARLGRSQLQCVPEVG